MIISFTPLCSLYKEAKLFFEITCIWRSRIQLALSRVTPASKMDSTASEDRW
jgi:hypothetical protein